MKKILVLGAGFVVKPAIDYFLDTCGYEIVVTSLDKAEADKLIDGRSKGTSLAWNVDRPELLDRLVSEADLVLSMIPPHLHLMVATSCLKHRKNMVTTSYVSPEMEALDTSCREQGIIILNEIGEDPGLDNMITKKMIDQVHSEQGRVAAVTSYGAGLPAFAHNNNPFGYKFSWSSHGLISAAQTSAAYLEKGKRIEVSARDLFDHHCLVDLDGIGTFETYPNRDAEKYLSYFDLDLGVSLYRGLLRYPGWCNTMKYFAALDLFNISSNKTFSGMTYADFLMNLIKTDKQSQLKQQLARYLNLEINSDFINKIEWLGMLKEEPVKVQHGGNGDILVELMTKKLFYGPSERDMVILYAEVVAEFTSYREKRICSFLLEGEPDGDSAMSRSVSLPAAIAARLIVENQIDLKGVWRPTDKAIYQPVLEEMEGFGYQFAVSSSRDYE